MGQAALRQHHRWQLRQVASVAEARTLLAAQAFDAVAVRHRLPDGTAFDLRHFAGQAALLIGVASGEEVVAVRAMRQGFVDYWIYDTPHRYALALPTQIERAALARRDDLQRSAANRRLAVQNRLLQAISRAQGEFMASSGPETAFDGLLQDFVALSDSGYGFIAEVQAEPGEAPSALPTLACRAVARLEWDAALRARRTREALEDPAFTYRLVRLLEPGLAAGQPVITNVPGPGIATDQAPDHPALDSFIGVPVRSSGQLLAYIGLANRPGGYGAELLDMLAPLVHTTGQLLLARRTEQQRIATESRLRESEGRWRNLTQLSSDWYWETDAQLRLTQVEDATERNRPVIDQLRPGMHPWDFPAINVAETHWREHRNVLESHQSFHNLDLEFRGPDGETYWASLSGVPVFAGPHFTGYRGVARSITARKRAEAHNEWLAFIDDLTGLPNRRLLLDHLQRALADSQSLQRCGALLFLDLDNFKDANDTLGPEGSDRLLQQVAGRLRNCVRPHDTVARFGGDEFMVLLEGLAPTLGEARLQAEALAQTVLQTLGQAYTVDDSELVSTPSIGIVVFNDHQVPPDELLKRTDLAMYEAKEAGRNTYCFFEPRMQEAAMARLRLESDLRQALAREALCVYYQPVVDRNGRTTGVEALVRWPLGGGGMRSPAEFIPVAERTGLIVALGRQVLSTACRQLATWACSPATRDLTIAVNVSAREFRHPQFVQQVLAVVDEAGANPARLKLEITESLLLHDLQDTVAKMLALRTQGITFSLDDFGTGYSSLSYLKRLPFDQLKIDQSFVRGILNDPHDAAVACTIIQLASSFGLVVVAEGVETTGQRDYLLDNGCESFQGYLFGRPVPVEALVLPG